PASFSTASASLSVGSMLATQMLSQEGEQSSFLSVYEELVAASQVKYKPSDATLPQPAANNLFSKLLAEEKTQASQMIFAQAPKAAAEHAAASAPLPAAKPVARKPEPSAPSIEGLR